MAVTVTTAAAGITITSTGGVFATLDEICTAVGSTSVMSRSGADPYVYDMLPAAGQVARIVTINPNCKILCEQNDT